MAHIQLRDLCGARSGDKGDISDLSLFADDERAYEALLSEVTAERVKAHFGELVTGDVERHEARNVLALKFVMHGALGGGAPRSLRSLETAQPLQTLEIAPFGRVWGAEIEIWRGFVVRGGGRRRAGGGSAAGRRRARRARA